MCKLHSPNSRCLWTKNNKLIQVSYEEPDVYHAGELGISYDDVFHIPFWVPLGDSRYYACSKQTPDHITEHRLVNQKIYCDLTILLQVIKLN